MISKEIWNQFSFWNCIIYKTPGCQKPNNGLSKDASSHIKIVIFNLTQRLHSVQFGFLCWLLSKSERQRRIPEQTNISYLERLLSLSPIKQTQGSSLKIFSPHLCLNQDQSRPRPLITIIIIWTNFDVIMMTIQGRVTHRLQNMSTSTKRAPVRSCLAFDQIKPSLRRC